MNPLLKEIRDKIRSELSLIHEDSFYMEYGNTTRGDGKVLMGPHVSVYIPLGTNRLPKWALKKVHEIFKTYYADIKSCKRTKGTHSFGVSDNKKYVEIVMTYW